MGRDRPIPEKAGKVEHRRASLTNQLEILSEFGDQDAKLDLIKSAVDTASGNVDDIETLLGTVDGKVDVISGNVDDVEALIGLYADDPTDQTVLGLLHYTEEHQHSAAQLYPLLANPVTLTKDAGAWAAFPATKTEIIPADTVTSPFDIHWVHASTISANGNYVLRLYKGLAGAEIVIADIPLSRTAASSQEGAIMCMTEVVPANTRISAALSSGNAAADTVDVKLGYHEY